VSVLGQTGRFHLGARPSWREELRAHNRYWDRRQKREVLATRMELAAAAARDKGEKPKLSLFRSIFRRIFGHAGRVKAAVLVALCLAPAAWSQGRAQVCGEERWDVKTLADDAAATVDLTPQDSTVDELAQGDRLCPTGDDARHADEQEVLRVEAVIACAKKEADRDIHLCLCAPDHWNPKTKTCDAQVGTKKANGSRFELIAESPDPACLKGSDQGGAITYGRFKLLRLIPDHEFTTGRTLIGQHVLVTGVRFHDKAHGQTGMSASCVELHPILDMEPAK